MRRPLAPAEAAGLRLLRTSHMFFLSPLLRLSRFKSLDLGDMDQKQPFAFAERTHRVPAVPVNGLLTRNITCMLSSPCQDRVIQSFVGSL